MDCDSVCLQPTDTSWVTTTIIDSCWIPLSHYYYLQTLTLLAWHEVAQDAVSGTSSITALQDRNVLKRAVVQCFKRPLVFHEAPLSGKGTKLVVLKNRVSYTFEIKRT